jgi:hypothetical protein
MEKKLLSCRALRAIKVQALLAEVNSHVNVVEVGLTVGLTFWVPQTGVDRSDPFRDAMRVRVDDRWDCAFECAVWVERGSDRAR